MRPDGTPDGSKAEWPTLARAGNGEGPQQDVTLIHAMQSRRATSKVFQVSVPCRSLDPESGRADAASWPPFVDVSAQHRMEADLRRHRDELESQVTAAHARAGPGQCHAGRLAALQPRDHRRDPGPRDLLGHRPALPLRQPTPTWRRSDRTADQVIGRTQGRDLRPPARQRGWPHGASRSLALAWRAAACSSFQSAARGHAGRQRTFYQVHFVPAWGADGRPCRAPT